MNIKLIEEASQNLLKVRKQEISEKQKETYLQMSINLNIILRDMKEQQIQFERMSNMAYYAGNTVLAEKFLNISKEINQEIQTIEEFLWLVRSIPNQQDSN